MLSQDVQGGGFERGKDVSRLKDGLHKRVCETNMLFGQVQRAIDRKH